MAGPLSPPTCRQLGFFNRLPCPHCGVLLRFKWGRALLATYLVVLSIAGLAASMTWPMDRHLVQSFAGPLIAVIFIVLAATLRRLPLAED